jgi:hypothetical protein
MALLGLVAGWRSTLQPAAGDKPRGCAPAPADAFEGWPKARAKTLRLSGVDVALALETEQHQATDKTEVVAYVEEFMTAFGLIERARIHTIRSSRNCSARSKAAAGRAPRTMSGRRPRLASTPITATS